MKASIVKYGFFSGVVVVLIPLIGHWVLGTDPDNYRMGEVIGYSAIVLSMLLIFIAVNEYKKSSPAQLIGFGNIFLIGLGISCIAGVMFGIYNWVFVTYLSPEFMDQYFAYYIENIKNSGAPPSEITQQITQLETEKEFFMNPLVSSAVMFFTVFGIGFIVSIISALSQSDKLSES